MTAACAGRKTSLTSIAITCFAAPVVVAANYVIVGVSGDDLDNSGFIDARDPETGEQQWRFYTTPQHKGDPWAWTPGPPKTRPGTVAIRN